MKYVALGVAAVVAAYISTRWMLELMAPGLLAAYSPDTVMRLLLAVEVTGGFLAALLGTWIAGGRPAFFGALAWALPLSSAMLIFVSSRSDSTLAAWKSFMAETFWVQLGLLLACILGAWLGHLPYRGAGRKPNNSSKPTPLRGAA